MRFDYFATLDYINSMTYRKITSTSFQNMNTNELRLYHEHIYWNTCKCSQLGCQCCQAPAIRKLLKRNFSRCYRCICCRDTFPFLKEIVITSPIKWRYGIDKVNHQHIYQEFARDDIYECILNQDNFILVCNYLCDTKIPSDTALYTEKEICNMAYKIMDKNGHTYLARNEKDKVYNLMILVQNNKNIQSRCLPIHTTFHIRPVVDIIASYLGLCLTMTEDCMIC